MSIAANRIVSSAAFAALYILLYYAADLLSAVQGYNGIASIIFLPAFVRLLGFLIIGYWIIPALCVVGAFLSVTGAYDLGPGYAAELAVTTFTAVGGPFGVFVASRLGDLKPSLSNLTPQRLLALSVGCAAGNTVFYALALRMVGIEGAGLQNALVIFFGDFIGTWTIIYLIKSVLTLYGRALRY